MDISLGMIGLRSLWMGGCRGLVASLLPLGMSGGGAGTFSTNESMGSDPVRSTNSLCCGRFDPDWPVLRQTTTDECLCGLHHRRQSGFDPQVSQWNNGRRTDKFLPRLQPYPRSWCQCVWDLGHSSDARCPLVRNIGIVVNENPLGKKISGRLLGREESLL